MTIIQEFQKNRMRKIEFQNLQEKMFDARDEIINLFKKGIFLYKDSTFKTKKEESEEELKEERVKKVIEYIENESKGINYDLFKKHFNFAVPSGLVKQLYEIKNKNKNDKLVNVIKSRLIDLKDKINKMSEDENKIEQPAKILKIFEKILKFN